MQCRVCEQEFKMSCRHIFTFVWLLVSSFNFQSVKLTWRHLNQQMSHQLTFPADGGPYSNHKTNHKTNPETKKMLILTLKTVKRRKSEKQNDVTSVWQMETNSTAAFCSIHFSGIKGRKVSLLLGDLVTELLIVMHCMRVLLFSYGKFTINSNKNIQFWYICTLENYKVTHLLKGFPRYRRIRKRTQLVGPTGRYKCERAVHPLKTQLTYSKTLEKQTHTKQS